MGTRLESGRRGATGEGPLAGYGLHAFAPGEVAPAWQAGENTWNLNYTLSGSVREVLPQGISEERPDDFMLLKPGGTHAWEVPADAHEPWQVVWFVFSPRVEWLPWLDLPEEFPHFCRIPLAGHALAGSIRCALLEAYEFACDPALSRQGLAMNALERALLWLHEAVGDLQHPVDPRVRQAMDLMTRRLAEPLSMPEVAAACGISVSRLGDLFRAATGRTPRDWQEQVRLRHARNLLMTTSLPVKYIAATCGYCDQRHFATRFRHHFGLSPGALRLWPTRDSEPDRGTP